MDRTRREARERGYVETVFGRRLYLPEIDSRNAQRRQYAERSAINAPMQGTAADIIKRAMIAIDAWLEPRRARGRASSCRSTTSWCFEVRGGGRGGAYGAEVCRRMSRGGEPRRAAGGRGKGRRELGRGALTRRLLQRGIRASGRKINRNNGYGPSGRNAELMGRPGHLIL